MFKRILALGIIVLFCLSSSFGEDPKRSSGVKLRPPVLKEKFFESTPLCGKEVESPYDVKEVVPKDIDGVHVRLGKAAEWFINHSVKVNGWSFTGWSKTGLDEDFRPWRLHVGLIGGELDVNTATDLAEQPTPRPQWQVLEDWERRRTQGVAVGIVFTRSF